VEVPYLFVKLVTLIYNQNPTFLKAYIFLAAQNAEVVQERIRLQNRLQRDKLDLTEEMELSKLEFEKNLREQKGALEEMTKKHDRLVLSHLAVIKVWIYDISHNLFESSRTPAIYILSR
jgi:cytochrome c-type biogenesis protein CcmH/NrfG